MDTTDMLALPYSLLDFSDSNIASPSNEPEPQQNNIDCTRSLSLTKQNMTPNQLSIKFYGNSHIILRPNIIVRGEVRLKVVQPVQASRIRLKFRAEEMAMVKIQDIGFDSNICRIDQVMITYFEVDIRLWGTEPTAYSLDSWETINVGEYEYPFALKFPNVNFPPSTDEPAGFYIHYVWSAHLDGPSFNGGIRSKDTIIPYRPTIACPTINKWHMSLTPPNTAINMYVQFPAKTFCPDEHVTLWVTMEDVSPHYSIRSIKYAFNKCHLGYIRLQKGVARKIKVVTILQSVVSGLPSRGSAQVPIHIHIPTRLVSPSFKSRHLCVYYELVFTMQFYDASLSIMKQEQFIAPIGIANLSNNHILHIPNLTSVKSYTDSKEAPYFFDPSLNAPPAIQYPADELNTPPAVAPPSYFDLNTLPPQFVKKDREERVEFRSRLIRPNMATNLGAPITMQEQSTETEW